jgi:nicotinic acid phosphoribosyltransferase
LDKKSRLKDIVSVDGKEYVKVSKDPVADDCYNIMSLDGKDLFYLKFNTYKDPKEVDYKYNKMGIVKLL